MRYHVVHIKTRFAEDWQRDIFEQQLFDAGFDTLDGEDAYIPSSEWESHRNEIEALCASTEGVEITGAEACPDENWNAAWEAEHPIQELPMGIRIIPHCAFGAGHHETTSMMIDALMKTDLRGKNVFDHGTGTGVLAIFAKRMGAARVVAIDIDEKSVANATENARLNGEEITVLQGEAPLIPEKGQTDHYDLIVANIHRNILLAHMQQYAAHLANGGELWLSGFYETDCKALQAAAEEQGLHLIAKHEANEWRMMQLRKEIS